LSESMAGQERNTGELGVITNSQRRTTVHDTELARVPMTLFNATSMHTILNPRSNCFDILLRHVTSRVRNEVGDPSSKYVSRSLAVIAISTQSKVPYLEHGNQ